jgi:hypothetical protein
MDMAGNACNVATSTVTSATSLVIPDALPMIHVDGAAAITGSTGCPWFGRELILRSNGGTWTITQGFAYGGFQLAGGTFSATDGDQITFIGTGARWIEKSRVAM